MLAEKGHQVIVFDNNKRGKLIELKIKILNLFVEISEISKNYQKRLEVSTPLYILRILMEQNISILIQI